MSVIDAQRLREDYSEYRIGSTPVAYEKMLAVLGLLPSDTRVLVAFDEFPPQVWMARDLPRLGRRFTSLSTGREVLYLTTDGLERMGVRSIEVLGGFELRREGVL